MAEPVSLLRIILQSCSWILFSTGVAALPQARLSGDTVPQSITYYIYPSSDTIDSPITDDPSVLLEGQPLTMAIHGFRGDHDVRSMHAIKEALLMAGRTNVVVMDWGPLADADEDSALRAYHSVRDHGVAEAAARAAQWIQSVMKSCKIGPSDVHLVGFSLGAHVAGLISQNLSSAIGRITALDPPRFGYEKAGTDLRLDKSDAVFVNAIHTSGGILSFTESTPIGHVDFFPNGDTVPQKGCPYENPIDIITCSHYMAFALFTETIFNKNALIATECDSWKSFNQGHCDNGTQAPMGFWTPATTRGKFFMKTGDGPPYGEEDPDNPLPDNVRPLLVYDTSEAFIQPQDLVNFLTHQGKTDASEVQSDAPAEGDDGSGVMKVKGGSKTTTTPDPPSFLNNAANVLSGGITLLLSSFVDERSTH